ncbi:MAG: xylulokinase [Spirochaetes bacterium]|nr:xylulokinase [Spirochaetota bacterium]
MYLMGIDVGTSGVKAILITEKGELKAEAVDTYDLHTPKPNWFEQNPDDWWNAAVSSIKQMLNKTGIDPSEIKGIGLSGQYHGLVILDKNNRVLRRSILWNDQRTAVQSDYIINKVGKDNLLRICATGGAPYFTACKLLWVRDNEPQIYEKICKMMLPKDYIRFKLTGEFATDVTDASGTLFLDIPNRKWSDEMPGRLGIDKEILPELVESPEISGKISRMAAEETGLKPGVPVAGGAGDQASAAVGIGIIEEGIASYSIGTSGVIYAATDGPKTDHGGRLNTFCHSVPGKWCVLACINSAAGSYQWYQDKLALWEQEQAEKRGVKIYEILEEEAARAPIGSDKLIFLPYLAGERHPYTDTNARGVFFGLHAGHGKANLVRSILEGVAFSFRDCLDVMREHGIKVNEIRATGGGAQSPIWMDIQVNVSREPIVMMDANAGGAAFGAAIFGGVCAGVFSSVKEACGRLVKTGDVLRPDAEKSEQYDKYFKLFRTLYPLLKDSYRKLSEI